VVIPVSGREDLKGVALIYSTQDLAGNLFSESFFDELIDELLVEEEKEMLASFNRTMLEHYRPC
jgi:hypothetical protein